MKQEKTIQEKMQILANLMIKRIESEDPIEQSELYFKEWVLKMKWKIKDAEVDHEEV